jgi:ABC-type multidrug transport system permease subunit
MNVFPGKYYPWIQKGLILSILICLILRSFFEINIPKSLFITIIISYILIEITHFYLTTDLD